MLSGPDGMPMRQATSSEILTGILEQMQMQTMLLDAIFRTSIWSPQEVCEQMGLHSKSKGQVIPFPWEIANDSGES